jgi:hypothetical protein
MPSVARVAYMPLRALALNVIANYSRARRKRRKPDSMTTVDPRAERHYSLDELTELRRNTLRYARTFPPGNERNQNQHRQLAVSLRTPFRNQKWLRTHTLEGAMLSNIDPVGTKGDPSD